MKTATVRDLRTRFPVMQGWLEEGESITITKSGKRIAMLTRAEPLPTTSMAEKMAKRFGNPVVPPGPKINITQLLIDDRGL